MSRTMFSGDFTKTGTTQLYPLGYTVWEAAGADIGTDAGDRCWVYVKNTSGGALAQGDLLMRTVATTAAWEVGKTPAAANNSHIVAGICNNAPANNEFFWMIREGRCKVLADTGGITAGQLLIPGNAVAGAADSVAITVLNTSVGRAMSVATATNTCDAWVHCKG